MYISMMSQIKDSLRQKGDCWNESEYYLDPITLRRVCRYTKTGLFNTTPTYHTNIAFTANSDYFVFVRGTEAARTAVFKACISSGEITQLIEPVDGIGHWGLIQAKPKSRYADGNGISGPSMCLAPKTRWLLFYAGRSLRAVQLDTLEERVLIADTGIEWKCGVISVNPSETHALFSARPAHPDLINGREPTQSYQDAFRNGGVLTRYIEVPLTGGEPRVVYEDDGFGCAHCPHSPMNEDLILIDRDKPGDIDRFSTRAWILNIKTSEKTPLNPLNDHKYQTHVAWGWDAKHLVYHGRAAGGGWFIGATRPDGEVIREWTFPLEHYGHVSAAPDRPAIILDGNVTSDSLLWLYYDQEKPRVEVIARHGTNWKGAPGQLPHPHPHSSQNGKFMTFNACYGDRTDVHSVEL